jgi:hypothetical protein
MARRTLPVLTVTPPDRSSTDDRTPRRCAKPPYRSLRELQSLGTAGLAAFLSLDRGGAV